MPTTLEQLVGNNPQSVKTEKNPQDNIYFGFIQKSDVTRIAVAIKSYEGHTFVDFREEYPNKENVWCPTKKGFTISTETSTLSDFRDILNKVIDHIEKS